MSSEIMQETTPLAECSAFHRGMSVLEASLRNTEDVSQLVCLSNLENMNAVFINEGISQSERLAKLNAIAISQMKVLTEDHRLLQLESADDTEKPQ